MNKLLVKADRMLKARRQKIQQALAELEIQLPPDAVEKLTGKVIVITGGSSGIGLETAKHVAKAGAKVILVARKLEKLERARASLVEDGGEAYTYRCDLNNLDAIDACAAQILADHGQVDVLVNNAGRSIRRPVLESLNNFHDLERTMQLNYFGAARMIFAVLPGMVARGDGHIVNISSIGVLASSPRFSSYVASKSALDAYCRSMASEVRSKGVAVSTIYMPLVRTAMIAPTKLYNYVPTWTPDQAGRVVLKTILTRPPYYGTFMGKTGALNFAMLPKLHIFVMSQLFGLFSSKTAEAAKDARDEH